MIDDEMEPYSSVEELLPLLDKWGWEIRINPHSLRPVELIEPIARFSSLEDLLNWVLREFEEKSHE